MVGGVGFLDNKKSLFFQHLGSLQQDFFIFLVKCSVFQENIHSQKINLPNRTFFLLEISVCTKSEISRFNFLLESEQSRLLFETFSMLSIFDKTTIDQLALTLPNAPVRTAICSRTSCPGNSSVALGPAPFRGAPHEPPRRERVQGGDSLHRTIRDELADQ